MSHRATNWAIQQRGLPPATKLVLWHLCDRHNPDYGCFPSQDQLAADVEISRASLNTHLDRLERAGLIQRERRLDEIHRQKSTRYFLGFEDDFRGGGGGGSGAPKGPAEPCPIPGHGSHNTPCPDSGHGNPCPDSGHGTPEPCPNLAESRVQILDTNLVIEPVITTPRDAHAREGADRGAARADVGGKADNDLADDPDPITDAEATCLAACGPGLCPASRSQIIGTGSVITGWLAAGYDLGADILPTLAERTVHVRISPIRTWDYFTAAIAERHARRLAHGAGRGVAGERGKGSTGSTHRPAGAPTGRSHLPASGDVVDMVAGWIADGRFVPPSAVSSRTRAALIARGLATDAQLRAMQIY
jgi:hypothetical protein